MITGCKNPEIPAWSASHLQCMKSDLNFAFCWVTLDMRYVDREVSLCMWAALASLCEFGCEQRRRTIGTRIQIDIDSSTTMYLNAGGSKKSLFHIDMSAVTGDFRVLGNASQRLLKREA